jgi:hypothetical protein
VSRNAAIALGVMGILSGLLVFWLAAHGHDDYEGKTSARPMIFAALLVGAGIVRMMSAQSAYVTQQKIQAPPDDPRWAPRDDGGQLAGRACAECGKKITVAFEAVRCNVCGEPAHEDCVDNHRAHAHAPPAVGPFR